MKRILCVLCATLIGVNPVGLKAFASEVEESLKKLEAALQKSAKEQEKNPKADKHADSEEDAEPGEMPRRMAFNSAMAMMLPQIQESIASGNINGATQMLQQLTMSSSEDVRKAASELLAALRKEQAAREKTAAAQVEEAIKHATEAVKNSKVPADLDAVIQELSSLKNRQEPRYYGGEMQTNRNKIESVYRFITQWQDYLAAQAASNAEKSRNILHDLANSEVIIIPRSELLTKAYEPVSSGEPSVQEIAEKMIAKVKELDGVSGLIEELRQLAAQKKLGSNNNLDAYIKELEQIDRNYREFQGGLSISVDIASGENLSPLALILPRSPLPTSNNTPAAIIPLKMKLLLLVMPRYIGAPEDTKAKEGEGVMAFVHRMGEEARTRGDFGVVTRANDTVRQLQRASAWGASDSRAFSNYQSAQNQEAAGQYMLAVTSYQNALAAGSDVVPAIKIGERLADIKKNYPEEYEKGMERYLHPPMQSPYGMYQGSIRNPAISMPNSASTPVPTPPKLVIPPASPSPSAAKPLPQQTPAK